MTTDLLLQRLTTTLTCKTSPRLWSHSIEEMLQLARSFWRRVATSGGRARLEALAHRDLASSGAQPEQQQQQQQQRQQQQQQQDTAPRAIKLLKGGKVWQGAAASSQCRSSAKHGGQAVWLTC